MLIYYESGHWSTSVIEAAHYNMDAYISYDNKLFSELVEISSNLSRDRTKD